MSNTPSSSSKNHSKKTNSGRDRDKNKSVASESGGSSQCDTPPLTEKDGAGPSQGKYAGIGPDSVQCVAEQVGAEINLEAVTNLAEDVSYKLRQTISTIALHSGLMKKSRIDSWDVNSVLMLSDTSPVVGTTSAPYTQFGDDRMCCQVENLLNVTDIALVPQTYAFANLPTVSVEWITDERSLNNNTNISVNLQNYYTKVARAILNLKKKPKELAVQDLTTNTRIGPIFPNLFNLAVLVLNDDNLNALNVPAKKPLQSNVLDMVDALCSNPCSLDTNIQQQFQRLFPVMVSNILGNGSLADKMVSILTKITRTWPSFIAIGKGILFDYLSQGTKERITPAMIRCVTALGRRALVECAEAHLDHLDASTHAHRALLDAATCLLRSEPTTFLEDFVTTDYTLYEMLGDSILPRRTLFPYTEKVTNYDDTTEKTSDEEMPYLPLRPVLRRPKLRLVPVPLKHTPKIPKDALFFPTKFRPNRRIHIRIKSCRSKEIPVRNRFVVDRTHSVSVYNRSVSAYNSNVSAYNSNVSAYDSSSSVVAASGYLNRFRYRLRKSSAFPLLGALTL